MRIQRGRVAESRTEMQIAEWTAEGVGKTLAEHSAARGMR